MKERKRIIIEIKDWIFYYYSQTVYIIRLKWYIYWFARIKTNTLYISLDDLYENIFCSTINLNNDNDNNNNKNVYLCFYNTKTQNMKL